MLSQAPARHLFHAMGMLLILGVTSCENGNDEAPKVTDTSQPVTSLETQLAGRMDPIAQFLRSQPVNETGQLHTDFMTVVEAVAEQEGCDRSSIRVFTISDDLVVGPATRG